ncbi:MAG TPA: hypothetical protein VGU72_04460 [Beijerinckiaceae bacterium]|jgi:hypothetical protein|nr:hypothetical protein [Beijerinckiaceae bacterium]
MSTKLKALGYRQPDAFDFDILRVAKEHCLRPFKRGWATAYNERHFPADRLNALVRMGLGAFDADEVGQIFIVTHEGRAALKQEALNQRAHDDTITRMFGDEGVTDWFRQFL